MRAGIFILTVILHPQFGKYPSTKFVWLSDNPIKLFQREDFAILFVLTMDDMDVDDTLEPRGIKRTADDDTGPPPKPKRIRVSPLY